MDDASYRDPSLAVLYDSLNPWGHSDDFYLDLVMSARAVLDVGCGTGRLLHRARDAGHTGRLCGLEPAAAMLDQARARSDVEWVLGPAASAGWDREFDLVVMTGHAFQELVEDDAIRASLAAIRTALVDGGRFAFDTRNPLVRPWDAWTSDRVHEVTGPGGERISVTVGVDTPVTGDVIRLNATYTSPARDRPRPDSGRMRFVDAATLSTFLAEAALRVDEQFGDWDRGPLTPASPEIVTIARRSP